MIKRLKKILTVIFIILFFASIWYKNGLKIKNCESIEFLFDTICKISAYGENAEAATGAAFEKIRDIDSKVDFYNETSEVSKINSAKSGERVSVSYETAQILGKALEISDKTGGAFDPTTAPLSELWNFKSASELPKDEDVKKELKKVSYKKVHLDKKNLEIWKDEDYIKIDLGGAAKGYACDAAAEILKSYNVCGTIDLGGNISCVGKNPKSSDGVWRVGLQKPFEPVGTYGETVEISDKSVVTSGTYQRYFESEGKRYHHILDVKTGYPKEADYNAVTIVSKSSLEADCLSTACFLLGREDGKKLAESFGAEIYFY